MIHHRGVDGEFEVELVRAAVDLGLREELLLADFAHVLADFALLLADFALPELSVVLGLSTGPPLVVFGVDFEPGRLEHAQLLDEGLLELLVVGRGDV